MIRNTTKATTFSLQLKTASRYIWGVTAFTGDGDDREMGDAPLEKLEFDLWGGQLGRPVVQEPEYAANAVALIIKRVTKPRADVDAVYARTLPRSSSNQIRALG